MSGQPTPLLVREDFVLLAAIGPASIYLWMEGRIGPSAQKSFMRDPNRALADELTAGAVSYLFDQGKALTKEVLLDILSAVEKATRLPEPSAPPTPGGPSVGDAILFGSISITQTEPKP